MVVGLLQARGQALAMSQLLELRAGDGNNAVIKARGAALVGLTLSGLEAIPSCASTLAEPYFAGSTLAPWPNRMAQGTWQNAGRVLRHPENDGNGNANHGLVFDREFRVVDQSESAVTLGTDIHDTDFDVYPYSVSFQVRYELLENRLSVTLSSHNVGATSAPIAFGSHPYFALPEGTRLTTYATTVALDGERMIPSRRGAITEIGMQAGEPQDAGKLALDHEFSGFSSAEAVAVLTYPDASEISVWQDQALPYQMIYVAKRFPWDAGFAPAVAIEPQSAAIDAFNNRLGLQTLEPGGSFSAGWFVQVGR